MIQLNLYHNIFTNVATNFIFIFKKRFIIYVIFFI